MNIRQRSAIALIAGLVLTASTACSPQAVDSPSTPSASATDTPTSGPEPTTEPTADPADPATWIISDTGVGPIEIGGRLAETLAELPATWRNDENCSWTAWWNAEDASYGVFFVRGIESEDAPIAEISVYTSSESPAAVPSPVTAEGLGIGATKDEVLAAYPGAVEGPAAVGSGTWLRLPGESEAHVFFEYREGIAGASDVVVTTRDQPAYEVCG